MYKLFKQAEFATTYTSSIITAYDHDKTQTQNEYANSTSHFNDKIVIFYNVYTKDESDVPRVQNITNEQLNLFDSSIHDVFVRSVGAPFEVGNPRIPTTLIAHDKAGGEIETLGLLWDYCQSKNHTNKKVGYIHSKGSFTPKPENEALRRFLTRGVASNECAQLPNQCNVCSSRMSPVPHPHTSGNMWLAHCGYIKNVIDPRLFEVAVKKVADSYSWPRRYNRACMGSFRYAAERWVHSHPDVQPCDLSDDVHFTWGYDHVPPPDFKIDLQPAPRFPLKVYAQQFKAPGYGCHYSFNIERKVVQVFEKDAILFHLEVCQGLYDKQPPSDWYGWKLYSPDLSINTTSHMWEDN